MPSKYISFSDLVDVCLQRALRPSQAERIQQMAIAGANSTIKQINSTGLYKRAGAEALVTATASPFIWTRPRLFNQMAAVAYDFSDRFGRVYPEHKEPGKNLTEEDFNYYYYSGDTIVFNGVSEGSEISVFYYEKPRRFVYYAEVERAARYNEDTDTWEYTAGIRTEEARESAQLKNSHWIIDHWYELCQEGTLSKMLNELGDKDRARQLFASFKELLKDVPANEQVGHTEISQLPGNAGGQ